MVYSWSLSMFHAISRRHSSPLLIPFNAMNIIAVLHRLQGTRGSDSATHDSATMLSWRPKSGYRMGPPRYKLVYKPL